jgi:electron transport complex protein RnfE
MFIHHTATDKPLPAELLLIAPLFALSTTLGMSLAAGLSFVAMLLVIAATVACVRRFIAWRLRLPSLILITATWISVFEMGLSAWLFGLREQMGVYLPLLAYNSLVLAVAEEHYLRVPLLPALSHAARTGLILFSLFLATGAVRELLAFGSLGAGVITVPDGATRGVGIASGTAGALLCVGLLLAFWNWLTGVFQSTRTAADQGSVRR